MRSPPFTAFTAGKTDSPSPHEHIRHISIAVFGLGPAVSGACIQAAASRRLYIGATAAKS